MLPYSANLVCFVLGLMTGSSLGETVEIEFQSKPQEVRTIVTKELELNCEIVVTNNTGTRVEDVDYIQSIQITDQDGDIVASVKNGTDEPIIKYEGFGNKSAQVVFDVGFPSGYLRLKVPFPDQSNAGNFTCTASVFKMKDNIPRIIDDDAEVTFEKISFPELVKVVRDDVLRDVHITQGDAYCTPPKINKFQYVNVTFGRTYAKAPRVILSHKSTIGARSGGVTGHNNNYIFTEKITTTGFLLGCYSYDNLLNTLAVYWVAFPSV